jgi:hypothetical protein
MPDYRLIQRHKVDNVWQEPGYELPLPQQLGDWLRDQGVAERIELPTVPIPPLPRIVDVVPRPPVLARAVRPFKCCGWK